VFVFVPQFYSAIDEFFLVAGYTFSFVFLLDLPASQQMTWIHTEGSTTDSHPYQEPVGDSVKVVLFFMIRLLVKSGPFTRQDLA